MQAKDLIGYLAVRTKPIKYSTGAEDYSMSTEPVRILAVTESHIVIEYTEHFLKGKTHVLDCRWNDNNWTDYQELMRMANRTKEKLAASNSKDSAEGEENHSEPVRN